MSEYGDGSPPPPYGGGNSEGQYGQQPYGTPPPQPYGSPPPQPQYGAPPPQPQYGAPAPPPPYGATPPPPQPYGAAPAAPMGYGAPYGAPMGAAGVPASMGKRFGARLIDIVIMGVVAGVLGALLIGGAATQVEVDPVTGEITQGGGTFVGAYLGYYLIMMVLGLLYEVGLIAMRGATLGKQMLGIKVVREIDGQVPGWGPAILRWLIPLLGSFVCIGQILVYLSPFFDSSGRNQGWHDKVAKTLVVQR